MIDWLDWSIDLGIDVPNLTGGVLQIWKEGVVPSGVFALQSWTDGDQSQYLSRESATWASLESSSSCMQVRIWAGKLEVRGNPIKWLTGQNVHGPDDPYLLASQVYERLSLLLGLKKRFPPSWCVRVSRIDVTQMIEMPSVQNAVDAITSLSFSSSKRQSKTAFDGLCVYFGKHSRRWAGKVYHKATEMRKNPQRGIDPDSIANYIRIEFCLRSMHLKDNGWDHLGAWSPEMSKQIFLRHFAKLTIPEGQNMERIKPNVPAKLLPYWHMWHAGTNMQQWFLENKSRTQFYHYRAELLRHGIDISRPYYPLPGDSVENLVDLVWERTKKQNYWLAFAA